MVVVKLGGRVQSEPTLAEAIASHWRANPRSLCIVHGGGDEVSTLQRQLGREPAFINGRRITTEGDLDLVRMVLSGSANKRLVAMLIAAGLPAVGISGEDGSLVCAEVIDAAQFGRAGKPTEVNDQLLRTLLNGGFLPVVSPVAQDIADDSGKALNVNGDDAAAAIAASLDAELWMIADVEGVLGADRQAIDTVDPGEMARLIDDGTVSRGMRAKLEAGFAALERGVPAVRIGGLEMFSDPHAGTSLSTTASLK